MFLAQLNNLIPSAIVPSVENQFKLRSVDERTSSFLFFIFRFISFQLACKPCRATRKRITRATRLTWKIRPTTLAQHFSSRSVNRGRRAFHPRVETRRIRAGSCAFSLGASDRTQPGIVRENSLNTI